MKLRFRLPLSGLLMFLGLAAGFFHTASAQEPPVSPAPLQRRPNVLFLFADDLATDGVGAFDGRDVRTPNLDKLAARGAMFTEAHNMGAWNGAVCIASRAMLLTGRTLWHAKAVAGKPELAAENAAGRLWPGMMKAAGYQTFMTGKWHNEIAPEVCFDTVRVPRVGGMPGTVKSSYNRPPSDGGEDEWNPADPSLGGYWQGGRHWTEVAAETAMGFVNEHATGTRNSSPAGNAEPGPAANPAANPVSNPPQPPPPYFAYVAFNAPHDPRQSPQEFLDLYKTEDIQVPKNFLPVYPFRDAIGMGPELRDEALAPFPRTPRAVQVHRREYYALISHLDHWIGKILEAVEKSGEADNTLIIFTADHGLALGRHGFMGKQSLYGHSTKVPLILAGPGIPAGARVDDPVYLQDAMATALEAAGAPKPQHVEFQSLLPLLKPGTTAKGRAAIYGSDLDRQRSITADGWKLIVYPKASVIRLYNLSEDPAEMHDLADDPDQRENIRSLFQKLAAEQRFLADPLPLDLKALEPQNPQPGATELLQQASKAFSKDFSVLEDNFRLKVAEAIGHADRVELFLLDPDLDFSTAGEQDLFHDKQPEKQFAVPPYKACARILSKLIVEEKDRNPLLAKIKTALEKPGDTYAGCHSPVHGIRVYSNFDLIFETSLCYQCGNFYLNNPVSSQWLSIPNNGLRELMLKLLPLADEEANRLPETLRKEEEPPGR